MRKITVTYGIDTLEERHDTPLAGDGTNYVAVAHTKAHL